MAKKRGSQKTGSQASPSTSDQANDLERIIAYLDTRYEQGLDCIHPDTKIVVSDGEYDAFRRELTSLRPDSELFATATRSMIVGVAQKVVHDPPMTSIEKASHEDIENQEQQLFKWITKSAEPAEGDEATVTIEDRKFNDQPVRYPADYLFQAYKLDGVAIAIYYENGKLARAGLRPRDGIHGEDVTAQVKYVAGVPNRLPKKITCSIRGELICKLTDFAKVQKSLAESGDKLRANPRNHTAGGIRQFKDPKKTKSMRLSFVAYSIESLDNPPWQTEIERSIWCQDTLGVPYVTASPFRFTDLATMESEISDLDFEVDGVIIGVNNLEDQEQLGRHGDPLTGNPKGKIAWKFREEEATPMIKEIEWQTGRTGKLTSVAIFDAVRLAGTNVSRATLHNAGFMERNQITIGSVISVRKAGKIIPKVTGVVSGQGDYPFPKVCPSCGEDTRLREGGTADMLELVCENENCPAQTVSSLCHFLATIGVLGLGESRVNTFVEGDAVSVPADFYRLDVDRAIACGLTRRQATLAVASIQMISSPDKFETEQLDEAIAAAMAGKKVIPLWQVFAALGIGAAGKSAGKALAGHFGSFEKIRSATQEELESVDDVGAITAIAIREYFDENAADIDSLLEFVDPVVPKSGGSLDGKIFCFSGGFPDGKKHWEKEVESRGGKCSSSVSKKTSYLVAGPGSGSKSEKAEKIGVPIISTDELMEMFS